MPLLAVSVTRTACVPASSITEKALPFATERAIGVSCEVVCGAGISTRGASFTASGTTFTKAVSAATSAPPAPLLPWSLTITCTLASPV